MLTHTLKTSIRVLMRRKFFTAVSLFCIAITLMVLIVVGALADNMINPAGAEQNFGNVLTVDRVKMTNDEQSSTWTSSPGYKFLNDYVLPLQTPDLIGYFMNSNGQALIDDQVNRFQIKYTDANYGDIVRLDFIEGQYFDHTQVDEGALVAVINEPTREAYFGTGTAIGETVFFSGQRYRVIGVVKREPELSNAAFADIWVPVTTQPSTNYQDDLMGGFNALIQADPSRFDAIKAEYRQLVDAFVNEEQPDRYTIAVSSANTRLERLAREMTGNQDNHESGMTQFLLFSVLGMLLFMSLPAVNLFNLNISRIMERASEIGVRKAFGAPRQKLMSQFIVENTLLTFIGGAIGLLLSLLALNLIEISGMIAYAEFNISWRLLTFTIIITLVFALFSGSYPAWRMARLDPVQALKGY